MCLRGMDCECGVGTAWVVGRSTYAFHQVKIVVLPDIVFLLIVSRFGLVEKDAVEVFRYYGFHLSSSFLMF